MSKTRNNAAKDRANEALAHATKVSLDENGGHERIAQELSRITGDTYSRQVVYQWLRPELDKRVEPRLGVGLALIDAAEAVGSVGTITVGKDGDVKFKPNVKKARKVETTKRKPLKIAWKVGDRVMPYGTTGTILQFGTGRHRNSAAVRLGDETKWVPLKDLKGAIDPSEL